VVIELNDDQRLRAERLARLKGEKCPRCGSSDLRCGVARADPGATCSTCGARMRKRTPRVSAPSITSGSTMKRRGLSVSSYTA
jgi:transcription elongation factor Elf1